MIDVSSYIENKNKLFESIQSKKYESKKNEIKRKIDVDLFLLQTSNILTLIFLSRPNSRFRQHLFHTIVIIIQSRPSLSPLLLLHSSLVSLSLSRKKEREEGWVCSLFTSPYVFARYWRFPPFHHSSFSPLHQYCTWTRFIYNIHAIRWSIFRSFSSSLPKWSST